MKFLSRIGLLGFLAIAAPLSWGQFSVSDDFSTLSGNWFNETVYGTGSFNVSAGGTNVLNYLDDAVTSGSNRVSRDWQPNAGSYAQDWQAQVDFTFNLSQVDGQVSSWSLYAGNLADITDNIHGSFFLTTTAGIPSFLVAVNFNTDGFLATPPAPVQIWNVPSNTVTLRASYLASSHTLSFAYDTDGSANGYSFIPVISATIDATGLNWGMTDLGGFGFRLAADNGVSSNTSNSIIAGQMYADNFAASAIPEPSSWASIMGSLMLLVAFWRRRKS